MRLCIQQRLFPTRWIGPRLRTPAAFAPIALIAQLALVLGLAGCATPGAGPGAQSDPSAEVKRFDDSTVKLIRTYFEARGWSFVGVNSPAAGSQWLVFVLNNSLQRSGEQSRARELNVFATAQGGARQVMSRSFWSQFDCTARTSQFQSGEEYSDQLASQRVASNPAVGQVLPVPANSSRDTVLTRACASTRPITSTTPGTAPRAGSGSGVVIAPGLALTNHHVVARCTSVDVLLAGQRYAAKVRRSDAQADLALLEAANLPRVSGPSLRNRATIGEAVMVAGFPLQGVLSSDLIVTDGIVNSLSGLASNTTQMQISAPVQPGNSGGPLLDRSGQLVGLVVAKLDALRALVLTGDIPQNINFAVRPELIAKFLQPENIRAVSGETELKLDTQTLASQARGFTLKVECKP